MAELMWGYGRCSECEQVTVQTEMLSVSPNIFDNHWVCIPCIKRNPIMVACLKAARKDRVNAKEKLRIKGVHSSI